MNPVNTDSYSPAHRMRTALDRCLRRRLAIAGLSAVTVSCATLPPREDADLPGMLAAAVTGALAHVKDNIPAGAIAIDTANVGSRPYVKAFAARFDFQVGDIAQLIRCDRFTGECLLSDPAGPPVIVALRPPQSGYTEAALTDFPALEVDVHWRRGAPPTRQLAGRTIEVRLDWTPRAGWVAFDSRITWKLH